MKKLTVIFTGLFIITTVFLPQQADAQTPDKMSYQAVIRDTGDDLVTNQSIGMQISILQGSASGTAVYVETQTPATNANGLISIEIGGGAGFNTIDWSNRPYFIKTETDPEGGTNYTITGTSQLLSVPYALYAENGLSAADKTKLDNLNDGAEPNVQSDWEQTDIMADDFIKNKPPIPSDVNQLDDIDNLLSSSSFSGSFDDLTDVPADLDIDDTDDFSGDFNDLNNIPVNLDTDATDDFSGSYENLTNLPTLFDGAWGSLSGTPTTISGYGITDAFDGAYSSLSGTPTLFSGSFADLTNKPTTIAGYGITDAFDGAWGSLSGTPTTISGYGITDAFDGAYSSLSGTPTLFSGSFADLTNKPTTIAGYGITDAFSGSYADLTNTPANATTSADGFMSSADKTKLDGIAAGAEVNVNADWDATSGDAQILNKPTTITTAQADAITANTAKVSAPTGTQTGEMQYWDGSAWVTIARGSTGQVLTFINGMPTWGIIPTAGDGEVQNPVTGAIWMDRNLGASQVATSSTDADSYGDLYQWGRAADGHQIRTSGTTSTLSTTDTPGHGDFITVGSSPNDWRSGQNDNLWQGVSGTNNPCPSGYRLPTEAEWNAEVSSWSGTNAAGAFASPLKLPMAGRRDYSNGSLNLVGTFGFYWSRTVGSASSRSLLFYSSDAYVATWYRAYGFSVRCLKD